MTTATQTTSYTFDATGKSLGRLSTELASVLRGKNTPAFAPHSAPKVHVKVENASKLAISESRLKEKAYMRWTGYPGGQRSMTLEQLVAKKGYSEALRRAVRGMLPNNKLRPVMLKNLHITE